MPFLIFLFIVMPILELMVILHVHGNFAALFGSTRAILLSMGMIFLSGTFGALAARKHGLAAWRQARSMAEQGQFPGDAVVAGCFILAGAALMLTPGYITDTLGILMILPPTRKILQKLMGRFFVGKVVVMGSSGKGSFQSTFGQSSRQHYRPRPGADRVIDVVDFKSRPIDGNGQP